MDKFKKVECLQLWFLLSIFKVNILLLSYKSFYSIVWACWCTWKHKMSQSETLSVRFPALKETCYALFDYLPFLITHVLHTLLFKKHIILLILPVSIYYLFSLKRCILLSGLWDPSLACKKKYEFCSGNSQAKWAAILTLFIDAQDAWM